jgi:hypothetical protein
MILISTLGFFNLCVESQHINLYILFKMCTKSVNFDADKHIHSLVPKILSVISTVSDTKTETGSKTVGGHLF